MAAFLQDLRFAARLLRKSPGFTLIAVAAIALGIGANTAIFSVVNGVLLKSLPYRDPDGIVIVWERNIPRGRETNSAGPANFLAWRDENHVFEQMAAVTPTFGANLTGAGDPAEVRTQMVNAEFFSILGVNPELGRPITREEDEADSSVVVISHRLWQQRLKGADVVGHPITLNGRAQTVVGVMPAGFYFLDRTVDVWYPIGFTAVSREPHGRSLTPIARLKPGVSVAQAQAEMETIAARLTARWPEFDTGWSINVRPIEQQITGEVRPALVILLGAVGFVLLIACANVANLLLARATGRQRELAVRAALGASRHRLIRQMLAESLLLAAAGGVAGFALAWGGVRFLTANLGDQIAFPRIDAIGVDARVLAFTALIALVSGIVFGFAPALTSAAINLNDALKEGGRSGSAGRTGKLRSAFVVIEVALALVLLVGAGLMIHSFVRVLANDLGADPTNVLTFDFRLPARESFKGLGMYRGSGLFEVSPVPAQTIERVFERLQSVPGVRSVAAVSSPPFVGQAFSMPFLVEGRPLPTTATAGARPSEQQTTDYFAVTSGFFNAMSIPLRSGRDFDSRDRADAPPVVIISEAMSKQFFPGEDAVGQYIRFDFVPDERPRQIIGIVGSTLNGPLETAARPAAYVPHVQQGPTFVGPYVYLRAGMTFVLRTAGPPMAMVADIKRAVADVDRTTPVANVHTLEQTLAGHLQQLQLAMWLLGMFGAVAALLTGTGIYGVLAYSVAQRTREFGLRMALGASASSVFAMVFRYATRIVGVGLGLGLVAALFLSGVLQASLFQVTRTDPATYVSVAVLLLVIAALACLIPVRRATSVSPIVALRHD